MPLAINVVRIDASVPLQCFRSGSGNWIGICEPLKITVQSATWGELMEDFSETLNGILTDLLRNNELDRFMRDRGWSTAGNIPERPDNVRFDLPFLPAMMANHGPQRSIY
jgi:hypothetical protein